MKYYFPFGQELKKVEQPDKNPKETFILGVYASAVHAKWVGEDGKQKVKALAVASEPEIFWTGENADIIISEIEIPTELGDLVPADKNLNGPSGRALNEKYLNPLGLTRDEVWLCDIISETRLNEKQLSALEKHYTEEIIKKFRLQPATIPIFNKSELGNEQRRMEILKELEESKAERIILLGDYPIKYFLMHFDHKFKGLSDFGKTEETYGKEQEIIINGRYYIVIPLCHPRQADKMSNHKKEWYELHNHWVQSRTNQV